VALLQNVRNFIIQLVEHFETVAPMVILARFFEDQRTVLNNGVTSTRRAETVQFFEHHRPYVGTVMIVGPECALQLASRDVERTSQRGREGRSPRQFARVESDDRHDRFLELKPFQSAVDLPRESGELF